MQQQDSTHPTGVRGPVRKHNDPGQATLDRARDRKATAAIQLRMSGATWDEVAQALGFPTGRAAIVATEQALERQLQDSGDREQMRAMAGARLERLLRAVWAKAIDPNSPEQMVAAGRAQALVDRHAKLFGLDAPSEVIVHTPTQNELEQWVARVVSHKVSPVEEYDIIGGELVSSEEVAQDPELAIEFEEDQ